MRQDHGPTARSGPPLVVVVIGASSGVGRETALLLSRHGHRLVLAARSRDALEAVAGACGSAGARDVHVEPTDIGDPEQVDALLDAAAARFGDVDVVIQCAAVTAFGRLEELPTEMFERVIRTNVLGTAAVARAALVRMRGRGRGTIVLVGSALGHATFPYQGPYVMSKFAITALVRLLRQENRDLPGVLVHGVYPGPVDTPLYALAGNVVGRAAQVPPPADDPAKVAAAVVRTVRAARHRDVQVGRANRAMILAFRLLPSVFDRVVGPFVRATTFGRRRAAPTSGNVFEPPGLARPPGALADPDVHRPDAAGDASSRPARSRPGR